MTEKPFDDDILTVQEVAELLHLHPDVIYEKVGNGEIPGAIRLGSGRNSPIRFSKRMLLEWIHRNATWPDVKGKEQKEGGEDAPVAQQ